MWKLGCEDLNNWIKSYSYEPNIYNIFITTESGAVRTCLIFKMQTVDETNNQRKL